MSVTAFPVLARILAERGLLGTRLGSVAIACAAVDDVSAWCILAAVVAVARAGDAVGTFVTTLAAAGAYTLVVATAGRRLLHRAAERWGTGGGTITPYLVGLAVVGAFASGWVTERAGVHALFGAFVARAVMPRQGGLAEGLADRIDDVVSTVFLPVFFAYTGLRTSIGLVSGGAMWLACGLILAAAVAGKLGGSALAARVTGMSWRDALGIGILMNTRGLMESSTSASRSASSPPRSTR